MEPLETGELRVLMSKLCVDVSWFDGFGNVATYLCDGHDDQKLILCKDGTIRNMKAPANCLSTNEEGKGNVEMKPCKVFTSCNSKVPEVENRKLKEVYRRCQH